MKRGLWQPIENETEYNVLCGLPSLQQQYYLVLVLSEFTDHSPFTSNNVRSPRTLDPSYGLIPSYMGQVVHGHERHHQCAAYGQQLMLQVRVLAWVGHVLVQHPSPFNLSSDIQLEKGYHNEGLWSSYRPLQGGRKTVARPF